MSNVPKRKRRAYRVLLLIHIIALGVLAILGTGGGGGSGGGALAPTTCVWDQSTSTWDNCTWAP